jgi:hypothetical protein
MPSEQVNDSANARERSQKYPPGRSGLDAAQSRTFLNSSLTSTVTITGVLAVPYHLGWAVKIRVVLAILIAVSIAFVPVRADAWKQLWSLPTANICGTGTGDKAYCLKYPATIYQFTYYFSAIFRSDFKDNFNLMMSVWNNAAYRNPVVSLGTSGFKVSATAVDPSICAKTFPPRDPYHIIQGSTNPDKNSYWIAWPSAWIVYNNNVNYSDPASGCTLNHSFLHEQGHGMEGFDHSTVTNAVMYPNDNAVVLLSNDDKAGLNSMYGAL